MSKGARNRNIRKEIREARARGEFARDVSPPLSMRSPSGIRNRLPIDPRKIAREKQAEAQGS